MSVSPDGLGPEATPAGGVDDGSDHALLPSLLTGTLKCPICLGALVEETSRLRCPEGHTYAILGAIPRMMVPRGDYTQDAQVRETSAAFGKQWTEFAEEAAVTRDDLLLHIPSGLTLAVFSGLVLDVGCGMGRYTALVAELANGVIGLDASASVDAGHKMWPELSFVQAEIAAPPFAPQTFDTVYSFGVLHHLPDPLEGFRTCFSLVRPGGQLVVWVYSAHGGTFRRGRRIARRLITRLPLAKRPIALSASIAIFSIVAFRSRFLRGYPRKLGFFRNKRLAQVYVDCYDAISAPTEVYLSEADCRVWLGSIAARRSGHERRPDGSGWIIWATP